VCVQQNFKVSISVSVPPAVCVQQSESGKYMGPSESVTLHLMLLMVSCRPPLWSSGQSSWLQNGDVLCFL
jgi:hypothetical protein